MKRNLLISCLLAGSLVSSCSSSHEEEILDREQAAQLKISLTSSNETFKTHNNTKIGNTSENTLTHVAFYVFKESGSLETSIAATSDEISSGDYTISCSTGNKYVYAVTNDAVLFGEVQKGTQFNNFEQMVTKAQTTSPSSPFAMVGKYGDLLELKPSTDGTTPSANFNIDVTRLVGKVTVTLGTEAASKFEIKQFKIVNANPYSNYFLQSSSYKPSDAVEPIKDNYDDYPAFNTWTDKYYIDTYDYVSAGQTAYALENWNSDPRRGNTTCLIIEGLYKGVGASGQNTFYRFNLGGKDVKWAFNRNTHYKVNISDVYEDGYKTEEEAEKPTDGKPTDPLVQDVKINATLQITPWTEKDQDHEIGKE